MNNNDFKNRTLLDSFADAIRGIWLCIKNERNMRFHTVAAAYVLFFAPFIGVTRGEYAVLLVIISVMITSEAFNTAIEQLCDYVCKNRNRLIGSVKDIAAGAVFISALFAVCIGIVLLFRPVKIWSLTCTVFTNPLYLMLLILSIVISVIYVVKGPDGIKKMVTKK